MNKQWNKRTIEGITFNAQEHGVERLGNCYSRYDTKITADKPFTEAQAMEYALSEKIGYGQVHGFPPSNRFPTSQAIYEDYVDSSD
jgi:hypothetical protein